MLFSMYPPLLQLIYRVVKCILYDTTFISTYPKRVGYGAQAPVNRRAGGATPAKRGKAAEHLESLRRAPRSSHAYSGFFRRNLIKLYQSLTFPHC